MLGSWLLEEQFYDKIIDDTGYDDSEQARQFVAHLHHQEHLQQEHLQEEIDGSTAQKTAEILPIRATFKGIIGCEAVVGCHFKDETDDESEGGGFGIGPEMGEKREEQPVPRILDEGASRSYNGEPYRRTVRFFEFVSKRLHILCFCPILELC